MNSNERRRALGRGQEPPGQNRGPTGQNRVAMRLSGGLPGQNRGDVGLNRAATGHHWQNLVATAQYRAGVVQNRSAVMQNQAAPVQNRRAPLQNRAAPLQNRAAPLQNRAAPLQNRAAPLQNRAAPLQSRAAPLQNRAAPLQNRAAPMQNQGAPLQNRAAPMQNRAAPMQNRAAPLPNRALLMQNRAAVVQNRETPVQNPAAPVQNPSAPVQNPSAPVQNPSAPVQNRGAPGHRRGVLGPLVGHQPREGVSLFHIPFPILAEPETAYRPKIPPRPGVLSLRRPTVLTSQETFFSMIRSALSSVYGDPTASSGCVDTQTDEPTSALDWMIQAFDKQHSVADDQSPSLGTEISSTSSVSLSPSEQSEVDRIAALYGNDRGAASELALERKSGTTKCDIDKPPSDSSSSSSRELGKTQTTSATSDGSCRLNDAVDDAGYSCLQAQVVEYIYSKKTPSETATAPVNGWSRGFQTNWRGNSWQSVAQEPVQYAECYLEDDIEEW